jgi:hypothetical protein
VTIDLSCVCGSNRLAFNHAVSDACAVKCEDCGAVVGSFGEIKRRVTQQIGRAD